MRTLKRSDYAGLVNYLLDPQNKQERVGDITITHCAAREPDVAILEVQHTQSLNQRAVSDKTYHLVVSFRSGEEPDARTLAAIEERLCAGLGFADHQRISVVHHDTDNLHVHIAICKIHPTRHTIHNPHNDYATLARVCADLETKFGLQRDNHLPGRRGAQSAADDMEAHAGMESLLGWIQRECRTGLVKADSWPDLHALLNAYGLAMRERGNGLVVSDEHGTTVKASSIDRSLSKARLEARLGPFVLPERAHVNEPASQESQPAGRTNSKPLTPRPGKAPPESVINDHTQEPPQGDRKRYRKAAIAGRIDTTHLYATYQQEQADARSLRAPAFLALRDRKDREIAAAKRHGRLQRAAIRLAVRDRMTKRVLYAAASKSLVNEIARIHADYQQERRQALNQYRRLAWADWLRDQAQKGNAEALAALRDRPGRGAVTGNTLGGQVQAGASQTGGDITKHGTVIRDVGGTPLRDTGDRLIVGNRFNARDLRTALMEARRLYGNRLHVEGSDAFRQAIAREAGHLGESITFDDPALEQYRTEALSQPQAKEEHHEHTSANRSRSGQPAGRGVQGDRAARDGAGQGGAESPQRGAGPIGVRPPPESRNRLRDLSSLGVVRIPGGAEVLLPGDVPDHVEQPRAAADHGVRRPVPGDRQVNAALAAVHKYVLEREQKRISLSDIPKHLAYDGFQGPASFGGLRTVDRQVLVLLQREDTIHVMAVDAARAHRLKSLRRGASLTVGPRGGITTGGRQR
ncbi:relaxase/mobilization nuclease-like protein [Pseudoduganella lurida]|uniref:Relaxase/mobilization nuclease-like protein n=2 Tax=Pseudoduganella lurida TaxID=1036180 RepID=A0A562R131_9BURK|nr:relaxase/mobilization nuclease-like protein [Pseudoduganella lurida]